MQGFIYRPSIQTAGCIVRERPASVITQIRLKRNKSYDAELDPEQLAQARRWHQTFQVNSIPGGVTSFARSSGPGGQHVNKTESKAITKWAVPQLLNFVPPLLHGGIRVSKYYSRRSDCISLQAQTSRSREENIEENRRKLFDELQKIYKDSVPNQSAPGKADKQKAMEKTFTESRLKSKRHLSAKKSSRKGGGGSSDG